jgi:type II secretory pathway pseudopilin PulG
MCHHDLLAASEGSPRVWPTRGRPSYGALAGYTLLELVAILIIAGILAAVLAPRFIGATGFTGQTTADKLLVAARYAETLAQNQGVTTSLAVGANSFSVTQNGRPVADPTLQSSFFVTPIPSGVTISPQTQVSFSRTESSRSVTVPTTFTITASGSSASVYITATGYIYECHSGNPCP